MVSFRVPNRKSEPQAQLGKLRLHLLEIKSTSQLCQFKYSRVKQTVYLDLHLRCLEKVKKHLKWWFDGNFPWYKVKKTP